jgi:hypothetical protein
MDRMMTRWLRRAMLGLSFLAVGVLTGHAAAHAVPGAERGEAGHCVLCHASLSPALAPAPVEAPAAIVQAAPIVASVAVPVRPVLPSDSRAPPIA